MEKKHTPGPWSQGRLLPTKQVMTIGAGERQRIDEIEQRMVFSGFSSEDEGRSRILVCKCENKEDAKLIAAAPELLKDGNSLANELAGILGSYGDEIAEVIGHTNVAVLYHHLQNIRVSISKATL